jgi:hypothetical protein
MSATLSAILIVAVLGCIYFLPAFVAGVRDHHNWGAILVLNLLLGWTILGWIIALVWACTALRETTETAATDKEMDPMRGDLATWDRY